MGQISFKIPDEEYDFLKWYSEKTAESMSSVYRNVTFSKFKNWKVEYLLQEFSNGAIGFKKFCKLSSVSFTEGMLLIEKHNIEPPIPEIIDEITTNTVLKFLQENE